MKREMTLYSIKEISSKTDKDLSEIPEYSMKDLLFLKYNNKIIFNEKEILEENLSSLKTMYSKKLSEGMDKNLFRDLSILEKYNNALVDVCIERLETGLDFKDIPMKLKFENELRKMLSEEFENIKDLLRNKINGKIIDESVD
jgi:hypothetical protein